MKLQAASKKEVIRIVIGTGAFDLLLIAGLFLLYQFDIIAFPFGKIVISSLIGSAVGIGNFILMCLTIQSAVGMTDQKKMKAKFQFSYNARMIIQSGWIVAALLLPRIHFIAGAAPVFFPKFTILYLQLTGRLYPVSEANKETEAPQE